MGDNYGGRMSVGSPRFFSAPPLSALFPTCLLELLPAYFRYASARRNTAEGPTLKFCVPTFSEHRVRKLEIIADLTLFFDTTMLP